MPSRLVDIYQRLARLPGGRRLFSRLVCFKAPYFGSIGPTLDSLAPGTATATLEHRRRITNHLGTVHAIALCNLAEFVGGLATEASTPRGMRWIPKGMQVEYLAKASGRQRATAHVPALDVREAGYEAPVTVEVRDTRDTVVFRANIDMWISPHKAGARRP